jgi:endonuclease/exonuclease/phosphatase family metal-dependent hydrolase
VWRAVAATAVAALAASCAGAAPGPSPSPTASATPTGSATPVVTPSPTDTPAPTPTPTPSPTPTATPSPTAEGTEASSATCADGLDNDEDGYTDCVDFDCRGKGACVPEDAADVCADALDNDQDGYTDCVDFDCRPTAACGAETGEVACGDGRDNDGDGYLDCVDFDCEGTTACGEERGPTLCLDHRDNDADGAVDCAETDCRDTPPCGPERTEAVCLDARDNDGDGYIDCADLECADACRSDVVRFVSWNVQSLGGVSSEEFTAAVAILRRLDGDVVCLQEVESWEGSRLASLARETGYAHVFQGRVSTPMAGGLTNACLSRFPFIEARSRSSGDISSDPAANETGRDLVQVRVEVLQGRRFLTVIAAHLKSGFEDADRVRRQVEVLRLAGIVDEVAAGHPGESIVAAGDFNEEVDGETLGTVFRAPPSGLPSSFVLGRDLAYPIVYDPFAPLRARDFVLAHPHIEDLPERDATRIPSGKRIDFVFHRGASARGSEVYDACADDGVDAAPAGDRLDKAGAPLACGINARAADHRPLVIDLVLP